jgi:transposase
LSESTGVSRDVTETLDVVPRQWFVTEHVREKFSCRSCETITQPPAPFHAIAKIEASFKMGELTVTLPKKPEAQKPAKKINVKSA